MVVRKNLLLLNASQNPNWYSIPFYFNRLTIYSSESSAILKTKSEFSNDPNGNNNYGSCDFVFVRLLSFLVRALFTFK